MSLPRRLAMMMVGRTARTLVASATPAAVLVALLACVFAWGQAAEAPAEGAPPPEPEPVRETALPASAASEVAEAPADIFNALPRFGQQLFGQARARMAEPAEQPEQQPAGTPVPASAPVPASYVVGPGDVLSLRVVVREWEQVAQDMTVTPDGFIFPEQLERMTAAGQTIEALRQAVTQAYSRIFANPEVTLSVSAQRAIEVYVTGDVARPGRYLQTGMATVLDALYAAGGPAEIGSYRRVRLTRVGAPAVEFDLYDYLLTGSREQDVLLNPGDTIFVPAMGAEVGLSGEVRRPARYELTDGATVADVVAMAGGLTPQAYGMLDLWRTDDRREWRLVSIDSADPGAAGMGTPVTDGDVVVARSIRDSVGNTVRILGAVKRPGYYPVESCPTVSALIGAAEGLAVNAHVGRGVITRLNAERHFEIVAFDVARALAGDPEHDLPLQAKDYVTIYEQDEVEPAFEVQVSGAVTRPGTYRWAANLRVSQLIARAGGLAPEAHADRADLLRLTEDQAWRVIAVDVGAALAGDADADLVLQRGDRLQVRTREEVGLAGEAHVAGLVRVPGSYPRREGMRVSDLLFAAGGPSPGAGPDIELTRGRFEGSPAPLRLALIGGPEDYTVEPDMVLADDDSVTVTGRGEFQAQADVVFLKGRVRGPGAYPVRSGPDDAPYTVWDLLEDGGGTLADANVAGIVVYRRRPEALEDAQQEDLQRVLASVNAEASQQQSAVSVETEEAAAALGQAVDYRLRQVMSTPGGLSIVLPPRPVREGDWVAAIPVDGRNLVATAGAEDNLALEPGDTVMVPRRVNTVMVLGAVPRSGAVPFVEGEMTEYYLNESGGVREDGAVNRMVVVHANGAVEPIARDTVLTPGDVVVVPTRHIVRTVRTESELQTWLRTIVPLAIAALVF